MAPISDWIDYQTHVGEPYHVGEYTVAPETKALVVKWAPHGGLVYTRPTAVYVQREGETDRISIPNITRRAYIALVVMSLLYGIILSMRYVRERR